MASYKLFRISQNLAMLDLHLCAERAESFQMLINRPASNVASARKRYFRVLIFTKQRAQKIIGCPDFLDIVIINTEIMHRATADFHRVAVDPLNPGSDSFHRL